MYTAGVLQRETRMKQLK